MKKWYAVQANREDNDWGYGSYDIEEAKAMLKSYPEGLIAVIEEGDDPICIEEIPYSDIYDDEEEDMKNFEVGTIYSDPTGIYRVDDINENGVTVTLIDGDDLNKGKTYEGVSAEEVAYFVENPFEEGFNEMDYQ